MRGGIDRDFVVETGTMIQKKPPRYPFGDEVEIYRDNIFVIVAVITTTIKTILPSFQLSSTMITSSKELQLAPISQR